MKIQNISRGKETTLLLSLGFKRLIISDSFIKSSISLFPEARTYQNLHHDLLKLGVT